MYFFVYVVILCVCVHIDSILGTFCRVSGLVLAWLCVCAVSLLFVSMCANTLECICNVHMSICFVVCMYIVCMPGGIRDARRCASEHL